MSDVLHERGIFCSACGEPIAGLVVKVDDAGSVRGEHVYSKAGGAQSWVKLLEVADGPNRTEYRHATCPPFASQGASLPAVEMVVPDNLEDVLAIFEGTEPPQSELVRRLREIVEQAPLAPGSEDVEREGWQFALDTYRTWAGLDLAVPAVQDASIMTLVHVRNAMLANGVWAPERSIPARIVFTMLRIFADERLKHS